MYGFKLDTGQGEVIVDADVLDGAQVSDAVPVLQQMSIVDSHLKLIVGAKDLYLQHNDRTSATFPAFTDKL